ncbi:hypothetical protein [Nocardia xishanensis]|uniref:Uncharacterized protein n=1 Tax=Nocardia xishanensis TaxID=238964 RepID=A0ABW7WRL5_9NOCA
MFGPFIPAAAMGCLGGIVALGTVAGQLLVTAPVAVSAAAPVPHDDQHSVPEEVTSAAVARARSRVTTSTAEAATR